MCKKEQAKSASSHHTVQFALLRVSVSAAQQIINMSRTFVLSASPNLNMQTSGHLTTDRNVFLSIKLVNSEKTELNQSFSIFYIPAVSNKFKPVGCLPLLSGWWWALHTAAWRHRTSKPGKRWPLQSDCGSLARRRTGRPVWNKTASPTGGRNKPNDCKSRSLLINRIFLVYSMWSSTLPNAIMSTLHTTTVQKRLWLVLRSQNYLHRSPSTLDTAPSCPPGGSPASPEPRSAFLCFYAGPGWPVRLERHFSAVKGKHSNPTPFTSWFSFKAFPELFWLWLLLYSAERQEFIRNHAVGAE